MMNVVTPQAQVYDPAQDIQWKQMPNGPVVLGFLDSPAARNRIICIFTTLSSLSLGGTVYAVAKFIVISGVSVAYGLAILTLASIIATIVSCLLQPSEAEIDWDLRQEAEGLLNGDPNSRLGYQVMRSQFVTKIVSDEEANKLMFADAHTKTYSQFINKHGSYSIRILDGTNKQALKPSFIAHVKETLSFDKRYNKDQIAQQIVDLEESCALGVNLLDVKRQAVTSYVVELMKFGDNPPKYEQFLKEHNNDAKAISLIDDKEAKKWLGRQFVETIRNVIHGSHLQAQGLIGLSQIHCDALDLFDPETRSSFQKVILQREIRRFQSELITLEQLSARNGIDAINSYISENGLQSLSSMFLNSACSQIILASDNDLSLINLTVDDVQREIDRRWLEVSFANPKEIQQKGLFATICKDNDIQRLKIPAHKLTQRALKETAHLSVCHMPQELFELGVLNADSRLPNGASIRERLQNELGKTEQLKQFAGLGQSFIFKYQLLSDEASSILQVLIEDYVKDEEFASKIERLRTKILSTYEEELKEAASKRDDRIKLPQKRIDELRERKVKINIELAQTREKLNATKLQLNAIEATRNANTSNSEEEEEEEAQGTTVIKSKEQQEYIDPADRKVKNDSKPQPDNKEAPYSNMSSLDKVIEFLTDYKNIKEYNIQNIEEKIQKFKVMIEPTREREVIKYAETEKFLADKRDHALQIVKDAEERIIRGLTSMATGKSSKSDAPLQI